MRTDAPTKVLLPIIAACLVSLSLWGPGILRAVDAYAQNKTSTLSTEDVADIQQLLWTNHTGYDFALRDGGDMWTSTFLPDAVLDNGPIHLEGEKAIRQFSLDYYKNDPKRLMRHWTSTFHVTPHAEGAILSAFYFTMTQEQGRPGLNIGSAGRYESLVVKTPGGWRIKHHVVYGEGAVNVLQVVNAQR